MQRSSQSAGVRPSRIMQYHTLRSFVLVLAIGLVTKSPACGFTIRRTDSLASTSELETGESSLLEVKYDLQTSKIGPAGKVDDAIALNESTTTATNTNVTINSNIDLVINTTGTPTLTVINKDLNAGISGPIQNVTKTSTTVTPNLTFKVESSNTYDLNLISTMSDKLTNERAKRNESEVFTTEIASERSLNYTIHIPNYYSDTVNSMKAVNPTKNIQYTNSPESTTEYKDNLMSEANTALRYTSTAESDDYNPINSTEVLLTTQDPTSSKFSLEISSQTTGETVPQLTSNNQVSDFTTNVESTLFIAQSPTALEESFNVTMLDFTTEANGEYLENNLLTTTGNPVETLNTEILNTKIVKEEPVTISLPTYETDKTIDKMQISTASTEETTSSDLIMSRAETAQINLENTPITTLMELKTEHVNAPEYTTRIFPTEVNVTNSPKLETSTIQTIGEGVKLYTEKVEFISSKRAGYLDNTETTSSKLEEATTENFANKTNTKETEPFGSMYETEGNESEVSDTLEVKNVTGIESQSQLVEDAIKEELLIEKTLHENEYVKARLGVKPALGSSTPPVLDNTPTTQEVVTEDVLSVKPINNEKKQSVALYSVSPNYKPLKKLDIHPTKPFVRDPDDNTWRNERISSLGIVFKPKNASKTFTEVLKNKTTELSNMAEKINKNDIPDLRIRLEKIAEIRKSKKKKINGLGDIVYSDYEESSSDNASVSREESTSPMSPQQKSKLISVTSTPPSSSTTDADVMNYIQKENFEMFKEEFATHPATSKNKSNRLREHYDSADDYDADYVTKMDLKKFTTPKADSFRPSSQDLILNTKKSFSVTYMPDRQPTVQYFPPTKKIKTTTKAALKPKVNIDEYDDYFKNKVNQFTYTHPKTDYGVSFGTPLPAQTNKNLDKQTTKTHSTPAYNNEEINKNLYLTSQPQVTNMHGGFLNNGNINKASYVIKHYKDFIADAVKSNEDDNLPFTVAPIQPMTISDIDQISTKKGLTQEENYDYNTQFHKDIVSHFVDNFNQNSDRFKVDFPVIYNNSVIHRTIDDTGRVLASSRTSMKRLYDTASPRPNFLANVKPCDANCESMRIVDLSPAYELHYYVPEQEEKEVVEPRQNVLPYRYRL